jgi:hypothetical protein
VEYFFVGLILLCGIVWLAGIFKILTSDNINLMKIILLCISCAFPIFPIIYLFRKPLINEVKNAPEKMANVAIDTAKVTGKIANTTTDFLLKNKINFSAI